MNLKDDQEWTFVGPGGRKSKMRCEFRTPKGAMSGGRWTVTIDDQVKGTFADFRQVADAVGGRMTKIAKHAGWTLQGFPAIGEPRMGFRLIDYFSGDERMQLFYTMTEPSVVEMIDSSGTIFHSTSFENPQQAHRWCIEKIDFEIARGNAWMVAGIPPNVQKEIEPKYRYTGPVTWLMSGQHKSRATGAETYHRNEIRIEFSDRAGVYHVMEYGISTQGDAKAHNLLTRLDLGNTYGSYAAAMKDVESRIKARESSGIWLIKEPITESSQLRRELARIVDIDPKGDHSLFAVYDHPPIGLTDGITLLIEPNGNEGWKLIVRAGTRSWDSDHVIDCQLYSVASDLLAMIASCEVERGYTMVSDSSEGTEMYLSAKEAALRDQSLGSWMRDIFGDVPPLLDEPRTGEGFDHVASVDLTPEGAISFNDIFANIATITPHKIASTSMISALNTDLAEKIQKKAGWNKLQHMIEDYKGSIQPMRDYQKELGKMVERYQGQSNDPVVNALVTEWNELMKKNRATELGSPILKALTTSDYKSYAPSISLDWSDEDLESYSDPEDPRSHR